MKNTEVLRTRKKTIFNRKKKARKIAESVRFVFVEMKTHQYCKKGKNSNNNLAFFPKLKFSTISHYSLCRAYFPSEIFIIKLKYYIQTRGAVIYNSVHLVVTELL